MNVIAHRGARGLFPENTLFAFKECQTFPISGIELDIVVSKDKQLIVSHEPWMNHLFCRTPEGHSITEMDQKSHNLYHMTKDQIQQYDCGITPNPRYPSQSTQKANKPSLLEVFELLSTVKPDFELLIELKSESALYGQFQPELTDYAQLVVDFLESQKINAQLLIQSFDPALLNELYRLQPSLRLGLLVENSLSVIKNLSYLNFKPAYYNPYHQLVDQEILYYLNSNSIKLIPWTVNDLPEAQRLADLGVSSIITDYPNLFV